MKRAAVLTLIFATTVLTQGCNTASTRIDPAKSAVKHGETASAPQKSHKRTVEITVPREARR